MHFAVETLSETYNSVEGTRENMFSHSIARIVVAWGTARFFVNAHMKEYSVFTLSFPNFISTKRETGSRYIFPFNAIERHYYAN